MTEPAVILEGVDNEESKLALYSTVHGAGRVMARVELRGAGVDESPHGYKRLNEVVAAHNASVRILHTLAPVGGRHGGSQRVRSL